MFPEKITDSKQSYRQRLAARPVGEKLRMLDALRDRQKAVGKRRSRKAELRRPESTL
jgi:hypothetical protein